MKFSAGYNRTQSTYVLYLPENDTDKEFQNWPEIIKEDFSKEPTYIWTGDIDNSSQKGSTKIADGSLIIDIENQRLSSGYNKYPMFSSYANTFLFSIDANASIEKPEKYSCFGVSMKNIKSLDSFPSYRYQICGREGNYSIVLTYMANNNDTSFKFKKALENFDISANNKLEVLKSKNKYDFYLNGELVSTQDLSNFEAVGIGVGYEAGSGSVLKIKYDNMSVKMPTTEIQSPVPLE